MILENIFRYPSFVGGARVSQADIRKILFMITVL